MLSGFNPLHEDRYSSNRNSHSLSEGQVKIIRQVCPKFTGFGKIPQGFGEIPQCLGSIGAVTGGRQALRSHLSLICEYELYILPNKKS